METVNVMSETPSRKGSSTETLLEFLCVKQRLSPLAGSKFLFLFLESDFLVSSFPFLSFRVVADAHRIAYVWNSSSADPIFGQVSSLRLCLCFGSRADCGHVSRLCLRFLSVNRTESRRTQQYLHAFPFREVIRRERRQQNSSASLV